MLLVAEPNGQNHASDADAERRRGLRIRQHRPVKVYEPLTSRYFGGQTEDVSTTGLRIELPAFAPVRTGQTLNICIGLDKAGQSLANRRQMVPARVVWISRERRINGKLEAGVEFLTGITARLRAA